MNGVTYTILEYLAWIGLGLAFLLAVVVCVSIALAISSAAHLLVRKWNSLTNRRRPQVVRRTV